MKSIETLSDLLHALSRCTGDEYRLLAQRLKLGKQEFMPFALWSDQAYTRVCIRKTEDFELILLCWNPGQQTSIHSHNKQECWVYALEGSFDEERFAFDDLSGNLKHISADAITSGGKSYMNDGMGYHQLSNSNEGRSMSLHLYVGPISECEVYDDEQKSFVTKALNYDAVAGIPVDL